MTIRRLPREVVDRIAAGEVVERPASVVKELVENALDAGATRIAVDVVDGGQGVIRVVDDGAGIPAEELELAFASHATSKISDPGELFHVASLGFRGEALSSIGSISRATIRSRPPTTDEGATIACDEGATGAVRPAGGAIGTTVEVRDLFCNTPVRRKFLKSARAEVGRIADWLNRLALSRPDVGFALTSDERELFRYPSGDSLLARIGRVHGAEFERDAIAVAGTRGSMTLEGFALPPGRDRGNGTLMWLYVNGRFVRDKSWLAAVREAYRGLLMRGRHPVVFLFLGIDPGEVDVNVHPTKEEVRFREPSALFSLTVRSLRAALGAGDLRPTVERSAASAPRAPETPTIFSPPAREATSPPLVRETSDAPVSTPARPHASAPSADDAANASARVTQLHDTYLVQEGPDGLWITDQHALHERILFEEIKARLADGPLAVQQLLVPVMVRLDATSVDRLQEHRVGLERFGIRFDVVGTDQVAVSGVPTVLGDADVAEVVRAAAERIADDVETLDAIADDVVAGLACKAAVKAGDHLSEPVARSLIEQGRAVASSPFCPHGRPVTVHVALSEIERWFRRRV